MQADTHMHVGKLELMDVPTEQITFQPRTAFRGLLAQALWASVPFPTATCMRREQNRTETRG